MKATEKTQMINLYKDQFNQFLGTGLEESKKTISKH